MRSPPTSPGINLSRALRLVLAAALLAAWQGALVHPLEHVDEHGGFVHLAGGHHGHDHHEDHDHDDGANALCGAIAAVAACVAGRIVLAMPSSAVADSATRAPLAVPRSVAAPAYRSQAPPQHS